ncbi:MAG: YafY family protein [Balneolaceae bacterium]
MNRIDRLTAMIIYLQGRRRVTVEELSERYSITPRTVYRDLRALQEAGVPLGSEPGRGYFIVKGYHLPPVHFSREEASSLLAGERYMNQWNETQLGHSYRSALDKIRAVLPSDDREYLELADRYLKVFHYHRKRGRESIPDEKIFHFLQNAIIRKKLIRVDYFSPYNEEKTSRNVEPLGLLLMEKYWYLAAWCRMRSDYRMFRLDRFEKYQEAGEELHPDSPHTLKEFYERNLHEEELEEVVVRFQKDIVRYVADQKYNHGWAWEQVTEKGVEMTFLCSYPDYLSRWLLIWGDAVTVVKNDRVKKRVQEVAAEVYRHHSGPDISTNNL